MQHQFWALKIQHCLWDACLIIFKTLGPNSASWYTKDIVTMYSFPNGSQCFLCAGEEDRLLNQEPFKVPFQSKCTCEDPFLISVPCSNHSCLARSDNYSTYFRGWKVWGWSSFSGGALLSPPRYSRQQISTDNNWTFCSRDIYTTLPHSKGGIKEAI